MTPTTLVQTASVTIAGNSVTARFDFSNVPPTILTIQNGTIPYFGFSGLTQPQYAALVAGTALGGTTCLLAQGLFDSNHDPLCEVNTFTATTTGNPTQSGANLPQSNTSPYIRDIVFTQTFNLDPSQMGPENARDSFNTGRHGSGSRGVQRLRHLPVPDGRSTIRPSLPAQHHDFRHRWTDETQWDAQTGWIFSGLLLLRT